MTSDTPLPPLLCLPQELRYEIYDHLCRREPRSYPFRQPPISSIDQRAPPTALLCACRYLYEEIQAYFYGKVTFRFVAQDIRRIKREDIDSASLIAIRQAKKIELRLQWLIMPNRAETSMSNWPYSMNGWLAEQINLLIDEGKSLELVTVSVTHALEGVELRSKMMMLAPLKKLAGKVRLRVGEEGELREGLEAYVRELNKAELPASGI
jgi:hypothetical protein